MSKDVIGTILKHEGGYQNKKQDQANKNSKGEWVGTNKGITPAVYEKHFGVVPTAKDMKRLTTAEAREIYEKRYVEPVKRNLGVDESHPAFPQIVDIAVNHGYKGAVVLLQRAAGAKVDGKAGPATKEAIAKTPDLNDRLVDVRHEEYDRIVKASPEKKVFAKGWHKRAESFRNGELRSEPDAVADGSLPRQEPLQGGSGGPENGQDPLVGGGLDSQRPEWQGGQGLLRSPDAGHGSGHPLGQALRTSW